MRGVIVLLGLALQDPGAVEKGKYTLTLLGKDAGAEEFSLEAFEDGQIVLHTKARFEAPIQGKMHLVSADTMLTMNPTYSPVRYAGLERVAGQERRSKIEWRDGSAYPDPRRPVKTSAAFLLDPNLTSQLIPILRRFEGPRQKLKVFSPLTMGDVELGIEDRGEVTLQGKDAAVRARELEIAIGALGLSGYLDAKRRLVRVTNPATGAVAELEGFEGLIPQPRGGLTLCPETVSESDVSFPSGALALAGSLTQHRVSKTAPAVVLIPEAGPRDRDGKRVGGKAEVEPLGAPEPERGLLRSLAYALSEAGITVLRADERGCGRSGGDFASARLSDFTSDVEAAVAYLRARTDVEAIGLVGHGEGALRASLVASKDPKIKAIFLLGGASCPLDQLLLEQIGLRLRDGGAKEESVGPLLERQKEVFRRIREAKGDWMDIDERRTFVGWLRDEFSLDPRLQLRKVAAPVVLCHGAADRQTLPFHAEALARERPEAELRLFPGLDHQFLKAGGKGGEPVDPARGVDADFLRVLSDRARALLR